MEESFVAKSLAAYPEAVAAAVLILGFVAARIASLALGRALVALDRRMARITTTDASVFSPRQITLSRAVVFWLVLILAAALAMRLLGVGGATVALNDVVLSFVPKALIAFTIVMAGHLLGLLARNLLTRLNEDIAPGSLGPRLLHGGVVAVAVVMALQHINVNITFITRLLLILIAIASGGLMLAFALGARRHVANLLAYRELSRLSIGERIRMDSLEGAIVEIYDTGVDIATEGGIASIPAARFAEASVLRMREDSRDD